MDCMEHFVIDCRKTREWFMVLGDDRDKILEKVWDENLENVKGSLLKKLWKEREKELTLCGAVGRIRPTCLYTVF